MTTRGCLPSSSKVVARVVEVRVRVPAGAHLLDRQVEDRRARAALRGRVRHARARGRRASAASATSSCSGVGSAVESRCCSSCPGFDSACATRWSGWRVIQPKISVDAASAPNCAAARAWSRMRTGASPASDVADRGRGDERADEMRRRSARAPSARRRRARSGRSRCAPRRGTPRARHRAARAPRARARAGRTELLRRPGGDVDSRMPRTRRAHRRIDASARRALHRQLRLGQRALDLGQDRQRLGKPSRAAQERAGSRSRRGSACARDATSMLAVRRCGSRTPTTCGPCTSTPFAERHAAQPDLLSLIAVSGIRRQHADARCSAAAAGPASRSRPRRSRRPASPHAPKR